MSGNAGAPAAPAAATTTTEEEWTTNPYTRNFNPGTTAGNKIFIEKSKGPADGSRIGDTIDQSKTLIDFVKQKASSFGPCVTHLPIEFDAAGNPTKFANIIDQYQAIPLSAVIRAAHKRYGTPLSQADPIPAATNNALWTQRDIDPKTQVTDRDTFYDRVNGSVVAVCLTNTLTPGALANLQLSKHEFTFVDSDGNMHQDGPVMLHKLLCKVDPATSVSIENHRLAIENARLHQFKNNVSEAISYMNHHHTNIVENGGTYEQDTFRRHGLQCLSSGPNAKFNDFLQSIEQDIQSGIGQHSQITVHKLFTSAELFYNNLVSKNEWDKVNPKDASIMALMTDIERLKKEIETKGKSNGNGKGNGGNPSGNGKGNGDDTEMFYGVQKWRTVNVGPSVTRDGVEWKWCPHHKHPRGHYSGLYYSNHDESTHAEWKQRKDARSNKTAATTDKQPSEAPKKLTIANELKNAFMTNLHVSEADIDKIIASASAQGN